MDKNDVETDSTMNEDIQVSNGGSESIFIETDSTYYTEGESNTPALDHVEANNISTVNNMEVENSLGVDESNDNKAESSSEDILNVNNVEAENSLEVDELIDNDEPETNPDEDESENVESQLMDDDTPGEASLPVQRLTRLPIARIKNIMKFDDEVHAASQEAVFLTTKATELFIENFVKEVFQCTLASKKKTVSKRDVEAAIFNQDYFMFLDGALD